MQGVVPITFVSACAVLEPLHTMPCLPTGAVTAKHAGRSPVLGAAAAWLGIFTPGVLMMFALLPWWSVFRKWPLYRR